MIVLIPYSEGRAIREFNPNHEKGGSSKGGQFAKKGGESAADVAAGTAQAAAKDQAERDRQMRNEAVTARMRNQRLGKDILVPASGRPAALADQPIPGGLSQKQVDALRREVQNDPSLNQRAKRTVAQAERDAAAEAEVAQAAEPESRITRFSDNSDDSVNETIFGQSVDVRELVDQMTSEITGETFKVDVENEGETGTTSNREWRSQRDMKREYDEYTTSAMEEVDETAYRDFSRNVESVHSRIEEIWNEENAPFEHDKENPIFPELKVGQEPRETKSFEDIVDGIDIADGHLTRGDVETIRERLRNTERIDEPSRRDISELWSDKYSDDYHDNASYDEIDSFDTWKENNNYADENDYDGEVTSGDAKLTIRMTGSNGSSITRSFERNGDGELQVNHDYFTAGTENHGLGKELFRGSIAAYEAHGVDKITVHANIDVGGYAWAKYGYLPDSSPSSFVPSFIQRALREGRITDAEASYAHSLITRDPKSMWALADATVNDTDLSGKVTKKKLGPLILLNTDWYGHIDLNDSVQVARMKAYIKKGKK